MNISEKIIRAKTDYDEVYDAGKKAEYDRFWDLFQNNGNRTSYNSVFGGRAWGDETFKPKYDIKPKGSGTIGYAFNQNGVTNLKQTLEDLGIEMDLSQVTGSAVMAFANVRSSELPVLDLRGCTSGQQLFANAGLLETVEKLIVSSSLTYSGSFGNCSKLENITFAGEIGKSIDFQYSPLTKASIESIVEHLWDGASGQKLTLNLAAVNKAFETAEGANNGSVSMEWLDLESSKPNWTIALA